MPFFFFKLKSTVAAIERRPFCEIPEDKAKVSEAQDGFLGNQAPQGAPGLAPILT